jgi:ATP-dependent Clp protease ATP-binding subunit ClpA
VFERFTEPARVAVAYSQQAARELGHDHIGSEHILLGLLANHADLVAQGLRSLDVTTERLRDRVRRTTGESHDIRSDEQIPFSADGRGALENALRESARFGRTYVGTEHMLLGVLADSGSRGSRVLLDLGATPAMVQTMLLDRVAAQRRTTPGALVQRLRSESQGMTSADWPGFGASAQVQRLAMAAASHARDDNRSEVEISDVMLALTSDGETAELLAGLGIDAAAVRDAVKRRHGPREPPRPGTLG